MVHSYIIFVKLIFYTFIIVEEAAKQTKIIREKVKNAFGVRVDQVLQGHGTCNTGNLARKCFDDPLKFSRALEIDYNLVHSIILIINLLRCKQYLQLDEFENLCSKAHDLHYQLYPWARMSPTVHKLLIHSSDIIKQFPLPIAYYSEDVSESWHKIYGQNLVSHARKISRESRILDTFNRAVYVTDPVISLIYIKNRLKGQWEKPITNEMNRYLGHR